jgi:hypothetical protein
MQRNFEPMRKQVEAWKGTRLPDESAKLVFCLAFVEARWRCSRFPLCISNIPMPRSQEPACVRETHSYGSARYAYRETSSSFRR